MKRQFLGIFFYLLYLLAMVRPVMPIIEYYANYEYIATVLCENKDKPYLECNGKCYLEKQLKEVDHTNHDHKSTVPGIELKDYPISPLNEFSCSFKEQQLIVTKSIDVYKNTSQNFLNTIFKPPRNLS
ncbi:hypothetical protein [uncultured Lutibacter sp.]|uniref:hypothetical protein n=1 Tax=uncultured Lutibacter sp. TaxID=437739 RepID=UPI0026264355|nr:hypothetical protein [uncultured Lutibacter sp.]